MKKVKYFLLTLFLAIWMLPTVALADMGAPQTTAYDVVITNPDGVTIGTGKRQITIPFDTKVTVNYEYETDGVLYGSVSYDGVYGEIKLSDAKVYSTDIDLSKFKKLDEKVELYVFKEGAYLYNGPSTAYGKVKGNTMIPVGQTISYEYYDEMWAYVEYKGTKGWLYNNSMQMYSNVEMTTAYKISSDNRLLALKNVTALNDLPKYNANKIQVNIPAGTEFTYDYYISAGRGRYVHVNYEGKEGWLDVMFSSIDGSVGDVVPEASCQDGMVLGDVDIYKEVNNIGSATGEKIPKGANVHLIYSFRENNYIWNRVSYNNKEVWIAKAATEDEFIPISYSSGYIMSYSNDSYLPIFEEPSEDSKELGGIGYGNTIEITYTYFENHTNWAYVEHNGVKGWVNTGELKYESSKPDSKCKQSLSNPETDDEEEESKKENKSENMLLKASIIAVSIALVIGLTVVVIVILVNKKKNK